MSEYNYYLSKNISLLEEIICEIQEMSGTYLDDDISLLKRGWDSDNGKRVMDVCVGCKHDLFNISKNIENIVDNIKKEKC